MSNSSSIGTSHLLQNKDNVVLDDEGMILCDFVPINNVVLMAMGKSPLKRILYLFFGSSKNLQEKFY